MDTNALLKADLLDVIFDNRNKDYGAYELRRTYPKRVIKSLFLTTLLIASTLCILAFAGKEQRKSRETMKGSVVVVELPIDLPPKEPEPRRPAPQPAAPTRTMAHTTNIQMVDDQTSIEAPSEQTDFINADIGPASILGDSPGDVITVEGSGNGNTNAELTPIAETPEVIETSVDIQASFDGNWTKFLLRNLDGNTPVANHAPAGIYKVMIQFVVDLDGAISDIRPLTNHGFGLEEEAIRVIKKSKNWEPAIKKGVKVKSYRRQPITFEVAEE